MGRKPIPRHIQSEIVALRARGLKLDAIWRRVRDPETELPDRRTVHRYMRRYDDLPESAKRLDRPWEWHLLNEQDLHWEASEYLLKMWLFAKEHPWLGGLSPTVRQVSWWWRVHQAALEICNPLDLILLAQRFAFREMVQDVLGEPMELGDLEAHLAYHPWEDDRRDVYLLAVEDDRIPPLRLDHAQMLRNVDRLKNILNTTPDVTFLDYISIGVNPECPELLFSQQIERLVQKAKEGHPNMFGIVFGSPKQIQRLLKGSTERSVNNERSRNQAEQE